MGWDDSDASEDEDWENNLEKQVKEREKELKRERGEDTDSEDDKPKPVAQPKPKAKPAVEVYVPLADPKLEKIRRQKLVEEQDAKLADDLFSGIEKNEEEIEAKAAEEDAKKKAEEEAKEVAKAAKKAQVTKVDAWDSVQLTTQGDVDSLVAVCSQKIDTGKAKGASRKFLVDLLKGLEANIEENDLIVLEKQINESVRVKKLSKADKNNVVAKKANDTPAKGTKINASSALDEMYGQDWDDWDEEDY